MEQKPYILEEYGEDLQRCMCCGLCRSLCPTYSLKGWESGSPRGRVQILKALLEGGIRANPFVMDRIYSCALCGYCLWRCPSGVRTTDAFKAARAILVEKGSYPEAIDTIEANILQAHNLYGFKKALWKKTIESMKAEAAMPWDKKEGIIYFPGCVTSLTKEGSEIAKASAYILDKAGLSWTTLGEEEWCCGNPLILSGKTLHAKDFALHNSEAVRNLGAKILVTSCAGCYRTFSQEYPRLIGSLGFQVLHITQLIESLLSRGKLNMEAAVPLRATYHDPCDLGRHSKVYEPPRNILKAIRGLELKEGARNRSTAACCGGGGLLRFTDPEGSMEIGFKRLREAQALGVEALISACPTCKLNLSEASSKANIGLRILDVTEIVAKAIQK
ncbi:(Fe-S)-binding protein [Candidatus Bathyarchaeota archaeon]|nr:(Fe-S)-binding protein [Candidatus Bathyarchaeota archaeon]MBS7627259.1 (Fe-S)-binding protein [Candidatus Bathyarchaeota archaeon]